MNKTIKKALVTIGSAATTFLLWKIIGSWFPFMTNAYTGFGFACLGGSLGAFCYDEIIENLDSAKTKIKDALKITDNDEYYDDYDEDDEYDNTYEDEYDDPFEEDIVDSKEEKESEEANVFQEAFYLEDQYYIDIVKWYYSLDTFKEARETYCKSKEIEFTPLKNIRWDINFFKETLLTIVDVCSDRINEQAKNAVDVATIINNMAYTMVYNAGYYTVVNGMDTVDKKNIISSLVNTNEDMTFTERLEAINRLCNLTGVVNPITKKHCVIENCDESGKGKIIKFGK